MASRHSFRRHKRGYHLQRALAGEYGSEIAERVARILSLDVQPRDVREVSPQNVAEVIRYLSPEDSARGEDFLKIPLPENYDAVFLYALAAAASGERAKRLKVIAALYSGMSPSLASRECNVDLGKVYLWLGRFRDGGPENI